MNSTISALINKVNATRAFGFSLKKLSVLALGTLLFAASCDNNNNDNDDEPISVVLNEIQFVGTDAIEILNNGNTVADLSDYWLCLGPGTYVRLGTLTPVSGSITALQPGAYLVLNYALTDDQGGLGLYSTNTFTDPNAIVDFVQYGAAGSARENVAVAAGIWTAGEFVPPLVRTGSIIFDGEGNAANDWAETTTPTLGAANSLTVPEPLRRSIVFNEVQYGNRDLIELYNNGEVMVDLSNYWLCLGPGTYVRIGTLTPESGSIDLAPGAFVVLPYTMPDNDAGLGLYSNNAFADPDAIVDFVQYGAAGSARENVAVQAGIWTAGEFVPTVRLNSYSIEFDGEGDAASDWSEEVNPSLGQANDTQVQTTTFNITVTNITNYLNTVVFNTPVGAGSAGPLTAANAQYSIDFQAVPGTSLSFATMQANSNDWFFAPNGEGIDLFDANGNPITGDVTSQVLFWDGGTEEEDPATEATQGGGFDDGAPDDDNTVRLVSGANPASDYIRVELAYAAGSPNGTFTLTITKLNDASADNFIITPGLVVLHAQDNPLFTAGQPDRGVGLAQIAEIGDPAVLNNWFNEAGTGGAPLRLSSSLSVFSPGIVYAFATDSDPFFTQGQPDRAMSGLSYIAEDGNTQFAYDYLTGLGLPVARNAETGPIGAGGDLTFTLEVPQGQNYKLGFSTMFVQSNDWFISFNNNGVALFDQNGTPFTGTSESRNLYLFDAGTEEDQPVGFGADQAPRQAGANTGAADPNNLIRRVASLDDVQFGKGTITSGPGVVYFQDPRGGYNLIRIDIQVQ